MSTEVLVAETPTFILWCSCYEASCATIGIAEGKTKSGMITPNLKVRMTGLYIFNPVAPEFIIPSEPLNAGDKVVMP